MDEDTRKAQPQAGHVFMVRNCGYSGLPSCAFRPTEALRLSSGLPPLVPKRVGMVTELREECLQEYLRVRCCGSIRRGDSLRLSASSQQRRAFALRCPALTIVRYLIRDHFH